jgi:hypothetical protein
MPTLDKRFQILENHKDLCYLIGDYSHLNIKQPYILVKAEMTLTMPIVGFPIKETVKKLREKHSWSKNQLLKLLHNLRKIETHRYVEEKQGMDRDGRLESPENQLRNILYLILELEDKEDRTAFINFDDIIEEAEFALDSFVIGLDMKTLLEKFNNLYIQWSQEKFERLLIAIKNVEEQRFYLYLHNFAFLEDGMLHPNYQIEDIKTALHKIEENREKEREIFKDIDKSIYEDFKKEMKDKTKRRMLIEKYINTMVKDKAQREKMGKAITAVMTAAMSTNSNGEIDLNDEETMQAILDMKDIENFDNLEELFGITEEDKKQMKKDFEKASIVYEKQKAKRENKKQEELNIDNLQKIEISEVTKK